MSNPHRGVWCAAYDTRHAGRMGANTDVAAAVAFLASERSAFITGEILDVNRGM